MASHLHVQGFLILLCLVWVPVFFACDVLANSEQELCSILYLDWHVRASLACTCNDWYQQVTSLQICCRYCLIYSNFLCFSFNFDIGSTSLYLRCDEHFGPASFLPAISLPVCLSDPFPSLATKLHIWYFNLWIAFTFSVRLKSLSASRVSSVILPEFIFQVNFFYFFPPCSKIRWHY